jgi:hypothetical protein
MNDQVLNFLKPFDVEKVGFEASTSIAPLYRALVKEDYRVQVSHPKKTRYIAEARIKRRPIPGWKSLPRKRRPNY